MFYQITADPVFFFVDDLAEQVERIRFSCAYACLQLLALWKKPRNG